MFGHSLQVLVFHTCPTPILGWFCSFFALVLLGFWVAHCCFQPILSLFLSPGRWTWISPPSSTVRTRSPRTSGASCPNTPPTSCAHGSSSISWWAPQLPKHPAKVEKKGQKNPKMNKSRWWFVWIYIQRSQSGFGFILGMTVFTAGGKNTPLMHEEANRGGLPQIIADGWCSIFFQLTAPKYCFPASLGVKAAPQVWLWHISNQSKYRITKSPHFWGWRCR